MSRVGLIYFPDQQRALAEICRVLRPGGRLSAAVYSTPDLNGFFSIPVGIIRRIAGLPAPAPGMPGPFSLGGEGVAEVEVVSGGAMRPAVLQDPELDLRGGRERVEGKEGGDHEERGQP